jgi:hypothetical protein
MTETALRYFLTYSGVDLPLKLSGELSADALRNRNTYFRAAYDALGQLRCCEKLVYGEVEMTHRYDYHANGALASAEVTIGDDDMQTMRFDIEGRRVSD